MSTVVVSDAAEDPQNLQVVRRAVVDLLSSLASPRRIAGTGSVALGADRDRCQHTREGKPMLRLVRIWWCQVAPKWHVLHEEHVDPPESPPRMSSDDCSRGSSTAGRRRVDTEAGASTDPAGSSAPTGQPDGERRRRGGRCSSPCLSFSVPQPPPS